MRAKKMERRSSTIKKVRWRKCVQSLAANVLALFERWLQYAAVPWLSEDHSIATRSRAFLSGREGFLCVRSYYCIQMLRGCDTLPWIRGDLGQYSQYCRYCDCRRPASAASRGIPQPGQEVVVESVVSRSGGERLSSHYRQWLKHEGCERHK